LPIDGLTTSIDGYITSKSSFSQMKSPGISTILAVAFLSTHGVLDCWRDELFGDKSRKECLYLHAS
jgi:hypothetical protein